MELTGKNVIITGGAKGIGREIVRDMIDEGARVAVFDIDAPGLKELTQVHGTIFTYECDLTRPKQVEKSVNEFYNEFGRIDVLVNNAGLLYNSPLVSFAIDGVKNTILKCGIKYCKRI